ncbi:TPA: four-helix bundle copper-binding protein [Enterobacter hormaechei]|uniref:four-helix bundle copper-binding protein n=1 Tax=Enterobacter hormaechei TaxID=158836 RepID=UPI0025A83787|nr:four-helix bundle copper-binding protein [Enterobacter hormaechei]EKT9368443.1 four-helix bundle copper-binding protein [Enterobacter hormaechei]EKW5511096.1 four-helix bundle copper-binding protein [Enterobacter hormaechei]EMD5671606.1 four-helix bundle copper-binding protein [Enterobacter hormaechei]EMF2143362.1 four-helix bundle copper-binding protein [Enterobacter hormaechei]
MTEQYADCIEACYRCAAACDYCAASCLKEEQLEMMRECVRLDIQCANICRLVGQLMSMDSEYAKAICKICAEVCQQCGNECGKHEHEHEHCQECAKKCNRCAELCLAMSA